MNSSGKKIGGKSFEERGRKEIVGTKSELEKEDTFLESLWSRLVNNNHGVAGKSAGKSAPIRVAIHWTATDEMSKNCLQVPGHLGNLYRKRIIFIQIIVGRVFWWMSEWIIKWMNR